MPRRVTFMRLSSCKVLILINKWLSGVPKKGLPVTNRGRSRLCRPIRECPVQCWVSWVGPWGPQVRANRSSEAPETVSWVAVPQLVLYQLDEEKSIVLYRFFTRSGRRNLVLLLLHELLGLLFYNNRRFPPKSVTLYVRGGRPVIYCPSAITTWFVHFLLEIKKTGESIWRYV